MRILWITLALDLLAASALIGLGLRDSRKKWGKSAWPADHMIKNHRNEEKDR